MKDMMMKTENIRRTREATNGKRKRDTKNEDYLSDVQQWSEVVELIHDFKQ